MMKEESEATNKVIELLKQNKYVLIHKLTIILLFRDLEEKLLLKTSENEEKQDKIKDLEIELQSSRDQVYKL